MEKIYKKLYFRLFNAMTQALEELGRGNSNGAKTARKEYSSRLRYRLRSCL